MSLRVQLFGVGLLTLVLPWAGYRYVQELEGALRDGLEQSLLASANTMAAALELQPLSSATPVPGATLDSTIYAHPLATPPSIDGYRNDWTSAMETARDLGSAAEYWAGLYERTVYVFLSVIDDDLIYQSAPTETPYGDRVLLLPGGDQNAWLLLHSSGPGGFRSQQTLAPLFAPSAQFEDRVIGYWRETSRGYDVEVRLPIDLVRGRLGLGIVDVDHAAQNDGAGDYAVTLERSWQTTGDLGPGAFVSRPRHLDAIGNQFLQSGRRMRIVDPIGWIMFDGGEIDPFIESFAPSSLSLAERFYRFILARGDAPYQGLENPPGRLADATLSSALQGEAVAAWYTRGPDASAVIAAAAPIRSGAGIRGGVLLEQGSDSILTLTNEALVRLMSFTLLASLIVAFGLLSYATLLSIRVRRLARAAETALSPEGEIRPSLPGRHARDEIGDLARSFSDLLNRLRDYTDYLTTLKAKLTHELRTPLAIVSTSLDNLEREPHDQQLSPYLTRLREGTDRLDAILVAMSEATLIEQAIADTEPESFAIGEVITSCVNAYRDVFRERNFELENRAADARILGSADLIAQMLDKLVDNAVSFSPLRTTITVALTCDDKEIGIRVTNTGPLLPESMRSQLFDSLVSMRDESSERRHLGLGLYIVALIVDFHRGRVSAEDLPDGSGVSFTIKLPRVR